MSLFKRETERWASLKRGGKTMYDWLFIWLPIIALTATLGIGFALGWWSGRKLQRKQLER